MPISTSVGVREDYLQSLVINRGKVGAPKKVNISNLE